MEKSNPREERKKRRTEENRLSILEAAEKVFMSCGYTHASVDDIADEAQFAKATIYRYFKSKSEIFIEVIKNSFNEFLDQLEEIHLKDAVAEEKIRELISVALKYFDRKKNVIRIFYSEKDTLASILKIDPGKRFSHASLQPRIPWSFIAKIKRITDTITSIIECGIESGEFRPVDPEKASSALAAMIRGSAFRGPFGSREFGLEETAEMLHRFFLDGIKKQP